MISSLIVITALVFGQGNGQCIGAITTEQGGKTQTVYTRPFSCAGKLKYSLHAKTSGSAGTSTSSQNGAVSSPTEAKQRIKIGEMKFNQNASVELVVTTSAGDSAKCDLKIASSPQSEVL